jgi:proline-rich protein PRCC
MKKWQEEYDTHVRALEKGVAKGFEGFEDSALSEVDAKKEMERAKKEIQEREERKAVTMGAGGGLEAPRMTMTVCIFYAKEFHSPDSIAYRPAN